MRERLVLEMVGGGIDGGIELARGGGVVVAFVDFDVVFDACRLHYYFQFGLPCDGGDAHLVSLKITNFLRNRRCCCRHHLYYDDC